MCANLLIMSSKTDVYHFALIRHWELHLESVWFNETLASFARLQRTQSHCLIWHSLVSAPKSVEQSSSLIEKQLESTRFSCAYRRSPRVLLHRLNLYFRNVKWNTTMN